MFALSPWEWALASLHIVGLVAAILAGRWLVRWRTYALVLACAVFVPMLGPLFACAAAYCSWRHARTARPVEPNGA